MEELLREIANELKEVNVNFERLFDVMPITSPTYGLDDIIQNCRKLVTRSLEA